MSSRGVPSRQLRGAYDRGVASQPADPILTFTAAKRCVNEGLIVHGGAQKYTERTPLDPRSSSPWIHLARPMGWDHCKSGNLQSLLPASAGEV
jgi:hypothetical protein